MNNLELNDEDGRLKWTSSMHEGESESITTFHMRKGPHFESMKEGP